MVLKVFILSLFSLLALSQVPRELSHDTCTDSNCFYCPTSVNTCEFCYWGYWLHDGTCVDCIFKVDRCEVCTQTGDHCFLCERGFYAISGTLCGICMNGIANCKDCSWDGSYCYACNHPYTLVDNECLYIPYPNQCEWGMWNYNGQCLPCWQRWGWCHVCALDGSECYVCQHGFYLVENGLCDVCEHAILGCNSCNNAGTWCYSCTAPYHEESGGCVLDT